MPPSGLSRSQAAYSSWASHPPTAVALFPEPEASRGRGCMDHPPPIHTHTSPPPHALSEGAVQTPARGQSSVEGTTPTALRGRAFFRCLGGELRN